MRSKNITVSPEADSAGGPVKSEKPEFFRLPKRGGDPFFGLSRAWYYAAEKRGVIQLKRLRDRGKLRGVTLVPYDQVRKFIQEAE